jgi:Cu/Ag efflux protein CusF
MITIKKTALNLFIAVTLGAGSITAFATEAANGTDASLNETISHVEKALAEVKKSDFAAANIHLKAARSSSLQITGDDAIVKQANASVIQGQIQSNRGEVEKSSALLTKGLELYKSL